ncbi:GOLD_domain-containing protein [Hexamita inflata]|uniref:GOLD domain-containing protein n=1 Tax=Hexamita inflata TaxID=28002 RepID=A0AA86TQ66_9EUKA|nr:GOLD domain-containing protein [Hexamita inflata]
MLTILPSLSMWLMIFEEKCFYYRCDTENQTILIQHNTQEPQLDQRHGGGNKLDVGYRFQVKNSKDEVVQGGKFIAAGKVDVTTTSHVHEQFKVCFVIDIDENENKEKVLRDYKRFAKRVDINITSSEELKKDQITKDELVAKSERLGNKINAARSQQDGSQYRRNNLESSVLSIESQYKLLTVLSIIVYVCLSYLANNRIKSYLKNQKM